MKTLVVTLSFLFFITCFSQNTKDVPEAYIKFPSPSNELTYEVKYYIDQAYDQIPERESLIFTCLDKKEKKGDRNQCKMNLSKTRIDLVKGYLIAKGVPEKDMQVLISPFNKKSAKAMSNAGYRQFASPSGIYSLMVYKSSDAPTKYAIASEPTLDPDRVQTFKIDPCYEEILYGNQGTTILIPENAFYTNCQFASCDVITVSLWEFYTIEDMFNAGLTTTSNGKQLVSGGMIYIKAECGGKELNLRPGKNIKITMPAEYQKDYLVFEGRENNNVINWIEDKEGTTEQLNQEGESEFNPENELYWSEEEQMLGVLMESSNLGWINLDIFYESDNVQDLFVTVDNPNDTLSVCMVFHDMKSILPGYYFNAEKAIKFKGIPRGHKVTIMAYKKDGNEMIVGYKNTTVGLSVKEELTMTRMSVVDFQNIVKSF